MVVVCIIFGVLVTVCVVTVAALFSAKDGFEDSAGFHEAPALPGGKAAVVSRQIQVQVPAQRPVAAGLELASD